MARPRVKICCIASVEEARLAVRYGASAIGLVSAMPSGPGPIAEDLIAAIAAATPRHVATFLLTCLGTAAEIAAQHRRCRTSAIQIVDSLPPGAHAELRRLLPGISLVQVVHVTGEAAIREALAVAPAVDALLLDSGNPSLGPRELGGTGRTHDWNVSRRIVERAPIPVYLAGGLRADNVAEAVATAHPYGVDVCSGVRTDGDLDEAKLAAFMDALI